MLFHTIEMQNEQKQFGSSARIEFQFCQLPANTKLKKIVAVDSIDHRQKDSLYVLDENLFDREYSRIFDCGIYNNLKSGTVDLYGINYYSPDLLDFLIARITEEKPYDYEVLLEWLERDKSFNGFYILGI